MSIALELTTGRNPLDDLAATVIAGLEQEAAEESGTPFFASIMEEVEAVPLASRRYTAAHFFLRQPDKFKVVVHYLARKVGVQRIAKMAGCSVHTVQAVRDRFPKSVATEKERLADLCGTAATLLVERIAENPESVPMTHAGLVAAQLIDKQAMLRGGPTTVIEHRHTMTHGAFNELLESLPTVEGKVIESAPDMHLTGGETGPIGAAAAALVPSPAATLDLGSMDSASLDLQRYAVPATLSATAPSSARGAQTGGEGVSRSGAGGNSEEA